MDVVRLVIPAAALLVVVGAFFGVVIARMTWADEATRAAKTKARYEDMQRTYLGIHEKDQETMATMRRTIEILQRQRS